MIGVDWFHDRMRLVKLFAKEVEVEEVAVCLPLEYKTAVLIYELSRHTNVVATRLDRYSTKEEAVEWLRERGIEVRSKRDALKAEYFLDCAAVLSRTAERAGKECIKTVELTKTGEEYLKKLGVKVRAISVDSSTIKGWGENVFGTAFGLLDVLMRLNIYPPDKTAAIVGFGRVGRGCARLLRSLGCNVMVVEMNESRRIEAAYEGFDVGGDYSSADIIVTCTGVAGVISENELERVKNGAILINLGAEWEIQPAGELVADYGDVKKYRLKNEYYVVADGYAANLAVGSGSPIEVMDRTFSAAILSLNYLKKDFEGMIPLPKEIEEKIARAWLFQQNVDYG